ncbi:MAG: hypothetical protein WBB82_11795 [Limnothrix sp.]
MKLKLSGLFALLIPLSGITSCGLIAAETTTSPQAIIVETELTTKPRQPIAATEPTVTITRYKIDSQCNKLVPTELEIPADSDRLDTAVKIIVGDRSNGDFRIAGYRLNLDESTKTATLDLRLPLDAPRNIYSLSHCEQFALLGEIRKTLISNADGAIDNVIFQIQGQPFAY